MAIHLPAPEGEPDSLLQELRQIRPEIKRYLAAELPDYLEETIFRVAMNPEVSSEVIGKITLERSVARRKIFTLLRGTIMAWIALVAASAGTDFLLTSHHAHTIADTAFWLVIMVIMEFFLLRYFEWRSEYRDYYMANFLIRTLEFGQRYLSDLSDDSIRDGLATMVQRTAIRYRVIYKRSASTHYFKTQVRQRARICCNDVLTLIPRLVEADHAGVEAINESIARLLIRTQTGYWYETADISIGEAPLRPTEAARIALTSFLKDRSVQASMVAAVGAIIVGSIALFH